MTHDDERDRELDAWLRQPMERLAPPSGSFERVTTRARRRKWAKAAAGTVAGVVIMAGAVPAVIAVRHNANNQTLETEGHSPSPSVTSTSPTPVTPGLPGFHPLSVSFVSGTIGYAWGTVKGSRFGAVAETTDLGASWTLLSTPRIKAALNSPTGDGQIRMVNGDVGYIYGATLYVTQDAGRTWTQQTTSPGYIDDLEAGGQHAWALVRPDGRASTSVQLYQSNAGDPTLTRVSAVPPQDVAAGTDSIAVNYFGKPKGQPKYSADVLFGGSAIWQGDNGTAWRQLTRQPCPATNAGAPLQNALLAASGTTPKRMAVACGYAGRKSIFTTVSDAKDWTRTADPTDLNGSLETLTMGPDGEIIVGNAGGGAQKLVDGTWSSFGPDGIPLGFVGFIGPGLVVALEDPLTGVKGTFAMTRHDGIEWDTIHQFG